MAVEAAEVRASLLTGGRMDALVVAAVVVGVCVDVLRFGACEAPLCVRLLCCFVDDREA